MSFRRYHFPDRFYRGSLEGHGGRDIDVEWDGTLAKRDVEGVGGLINVSQKKDAGKASKSCNPNIYAVFLKSSRGTLN